MSIGRREFITLLGGTAAWPLAARAQQPALPVIGYLGNESPEQYPDRVSAFRRGLSETGYVEGRNVAIEYRWAAEDERMPELAADLVRRQVNVIATFGGPAAALAAKAATATIPVIFRVAGDPVALGLVNRLNRPGVNLTGVTTLGIEVTPKRLELMHEVVPAATTIGVLDNPTGGGRGGAQRDLESAARTLGLKLQLLEATTEREFDAAFVGLSRLKAGGLLISVNTFFVSRAEQLAQLTVRYAMPAIFQYRDFAAAGGLMSYGGSLTEADRQVGVYAGRVLKGEKPANLPVQQVTKVELIINLKTARALGLEIPPALLARADEMIE